MISDECWTREKPNGVIVRIRLEDFRPAKVGGVGLKTVDKRKTGVGSVRHWVGGEKLKARSNFGFAVFTIFATLR